VNKDPISITRPPASIHQSPAPIASGNVASARTNSTMISPNATIAIAPASRVSQPPSVINPITPRIAHPSGTKAAERQKFTSVAGCICQYAPKARLSPSAPLIHVWNTAITKATLAASVSTMRTTDIAANEPVVETSSLVCTV
jgi:hypothetical protein